MAGLFCNQTLPSSVGGDAVRIWTAGKQTNWRIATYSVLIDRVVGVVSLAIVVTACLPWTLSLVRNPVGRSTLLLIGLGCLAAGIFFVNLAWQRLRINAGLRHDTSPPPQPSLSESCARRAPSRVFSACRSSSIF
jgi:hypothetical protein